ncbi:hypothetical protein [Pantoea sp. CCBC3-3-1]|uniref:hypothetical protein n=1 Tax=Pantoea sp. CCBC3-3-1 TaxID=2490851 RepID=UPI0011BF6B30|nr:hypothetical protein [Pantoea sp. CCBC3-3-1]
MPKTIDEVADEFFNGNLAEMARANSVTPQLLSKWKKKGYMVMDGILMSPRREIVDESGKRIRDPADKANGSPSNDKN